MPDIADKYRLPDYVTKRLRYFDGQFLKDDDFIAEQNYYVDRMQRHDRLLHVSGIAEGLTVEIDPGNPKRVKVLPGTALDSAGRQILLEQPAFVQPASGMSGMVYLEIAFNEDVADEADNQGVKGFTRFVQAPKLTFYTPANKPAGAILLSDLTIAADGKVLQVGTGVRQYTGLKLPGPASALGGGTLRSRGDASPGWAELRAHLSVQGSLTVSETVTAATLTFPAPPGDPAPVLTARTMPTDQGGSSERTELILFHGNDGTAGSGPDTITLRAPAIRLQTYNNASVSGIDNAAGSNDRLTIDPDGNANLYGNIRIGSWQCVNLNGDYLGNLIYGTGLIGFNIARGADNRWTSKSDSAHNGSSAIWGNINGDLYIATVPNSSTPAAAQTLTDSQVVANVKMSISSAGNVSISGDTAMKKLAFTETGTAVRFNAGTTTGNFNYIMTASNDTGVKVQEWVNSSTYASEGGPNAYTLRNQGGPFNLGHSAYPTSILGNSITLKANASIDGTLTVSGGLLKTTALSRITPLYIRGTGLNNNAPPLVILGSTTVLSSAGRGLTLIVLRKDTHATVSTATYDTYGDAATHGTLATALNGVTKEQIGILTSYDAWEGALSDSLRTAFKRLGLHKALMITTADVRRPYAAVFEGVVEATVGIAKAVEVLLSSSGWAPYAEIRGWFMDGSFVATGTAPNALTDVTGSRAVLTVGETGNIDLAARTDGGGKLSFGRAKKWLLTFDSDKNFGSDKAFILYKEDSGFFGTYGTAAENLRLSIGVFNDFGNATNCGDTLDIQGGAQLTLNAGSWDSELNTEIGTPAVGDDLRGISFRINNVEMARMNKDGALQYRNALGNKIIFWTGGANDTYGFGLNGSNLNGFFHADAYFSLRKNGYDGTEVFKVDGHGNMTLTGNFNPSYVSAWQERTNNNADLTLEFNVGFFPVLVSVIVQFCGSDGNYTDLYSQVPPARTSWDDMDSRGETVYYFTGTKVFVRVKGSSVGADIYNGWYKIRFKVYAWRAV